MTDDSNVKYEYKGELDLEGKACGHGIAVDAIDDDDVTTEGTFFANKFHGFGK